MIFGVLLPALVALSPPSAATSSARLCTTETCAASAADPPVVPVPYAAQPSCAGSTCRPSARAAGDGSVLVPASAGRAHAAPAPAARAPAAHAAMTRRRMGACL